MSIPQLSLIELLDEFGFMPESIDSNRLNFINIIAPNEEEKNSSYIYAISKKDKSHVLIHEDVFDGVFFTIQGYVNNGDMDNALKSRQYLTSNIRGLHEGTVEQYDLIKIRRGSGTDLKIKTLSADNKLIMEVISMLEMELVEDKDEMDELSDILITLCIGSMNPMGNIFKSVLVRFKPNGVKAIVPVMVFDLIKALNEFKISIVRNVMEKMKYMLLNVNSMERRSVIKKEEQHVSIVCIKK